MPPSSPESGRPDTAFLRRRNDLWQRLRQAEPGTSEFEALLMELSSLIHWPRERVLAGLGLDEHEPDAG